MSDLVYAGIGSRETPQDVLLQMSTIASKLAKIGFTLRSGAAPGADSAFESGCNLAKGEKEIYIPWKGFNGSSSVNYHVSEEALAIASMFHPAWNRLSRGAKQLMGRNSYQVLGKDLSSPVAFVVCWTPEGSGHGGTGQAIRIARSLGIPVYDLGRVDQKQVLFDLAQKVISLT